MHNQAKSAELWVSRLRRFGLWLVPVVLYGATVVVELLLVALMRWVVVYVGVVVLGALFSFGSFADELAYLAAFGPIVWSLLAFVWSSRGWFWRWRSGARSPAPGELELVRNALQGLEARELRIAERLEVHVLDVAWPWAGVRGGALMLSRVLVESDFLAAVLAHELGHVASADARLTDALQRLSLWGDPLGAHLSDAVADGCGGSGTSDGALFWMLRWVVRLCGGGVGVGVFGWLWSVYWRHREFAADAHAVSLGWGEELLRFLEEYELALDGPDCGVLFKRSEHPPVALRVERLRVLLERSS